MNTDCVEYVVVRIAICTEGYRAIYNGKIHNTSVCIVYVTQCQFATTVNTYCVVIRIAICTEGHGAIYNGINHYT